MQNLISPSYTFTPGAAGVGTLNLSGISGFSIKRLVAVVNITRGVVIYSPVNPATNVASTTLTLGVDTSTHNSGDTLWIKYESSQSDNLQVGGADVAVGNPVPVAGPLTIVSGNFTRPANTTAYASGQIIANSTTAGSCSAISLAAARANDAAGSVRRVYLKVNDTAWLNATVRVHLYRSSPTYAAGDGGTYTGNTTESGYLGSLDVTLSRQFSDPYVSGLGVPNDGGEIVFLPASGTQNIHAVLEARSAPTPAASKVFTLAAEVYQ